MWVVRVGIPFSRRSGECRKGEDEICMIARLVTLPSVTVKGHRGEGEKQKLPTEKQSAFTEGCGTRRSYTTVTHLDCFHFRCPVNVLKQKIF
jgi:hypothetical protein